MRSLINSAYLHGRQRPGMLKVLNLDNNPIIHQVNRYNLLGQTILLDFCTGNLFINVAHNIGV